eukprot:5157689-Prymnesium_polylepis.1
MRRAAHRSGLRIRASARASRPAGRRRAAVSANRTRLGAVRERVFGNRQLYADGTGFDPGSIMMNDQGNETPYGDGEAPWIVVENGDVSYTRRRPARSRALTRIYEPWIEPYYPISTMPPTTRGNGNNLSDPIKFIDPPLRTEIRTRSI